MVSIHSDIFWKEIWVCIALSAAKIDPDHNWWVVLYSFGGEIRMVAANRWQQPLDLCMGVSEYLECTFMRSEQLASLFWSPELMFMSKASLCLIMYLVSNGFCVEKWLGMLRSFCNWCRMVLIVVFLTNSGLFFVVGLLSGSDSSSPHIVASYWCH